jgi:phosphoribosylaminoimidazolecarboxamide formyltransferase / IMP cyclohydrolase
MLASLHVARSRSSSSCSPLRVRQDGCGRATLAARGVELLSTGGTAKALRDAGLVVKDVAELTSFPEMLDGRVKTLHPKVHGGLLGRRDDPSHVAQLAAHGIAPIDMVVVNLYPFERIAGQMDAGWEELIENIDIGGPAMIRSAAKNHDGVCVVVDPSDYAQVQQHVTATGGTLIIGHQGVRPHRRL